jgi:Flp pilus assembly protein TadD
MEPQETQVHERPRYDASPREGDGRSEPIPTAATLSSMADILAAQGKDTECEFVLKRCIGQYPRYTPAHNSLAELQMRQGRVKEAAQVLSTALEIRPADPVLLNNLGMCFLVHKEYERALDFFTRAAALVPENEKYRANMATSLGMLGRDDEALSLMEQILPAEKAKLNLEVLRTARARSAGSENNGP